MTIGEYTIHTIETGRFGLDGGAMFGVVPKNLWSKTNPPDDQNRIKMSMNVLLLVHASGRKILIDNGVGHKYNEKFASIYGIDHGQFTIDRSLHDLGFSRSDITDVVLTHLHFDHAGGSTELDAGGQPVPAFPSARYYVQRRQYEWALNPTEKDRASFLPSDFVPLKEAGALELLEDADGVFSQIRFFIAHGHTMYQQLPIISDGASTMMFCGDLFPMSAHIPVPYVMAYDIQPLVTMDEKRNILTTASEENWLLFFEHDPVVKMGRVVRDAKGYRLVPEK